MDTLHFYHHNKALLLESGEALQKYTLAYQTFGKLNADKSNVVWVIHALTANADPTEWWPDIVSVDGAINPKEHFIICANVLGSHYGSTSPLSTNPQTGFPYYHDFPIITTRDLANTYEHLAQHLGINRIKLLVGASMGGQQAMEWAISTQISIDHLLLIATNAKHSPYGIAFNESQRMAIRADQTWQQNKNGAGMAGLEAARSIALISYRSKAGYNLTQSEQENDKIDDFKASSYQQYQGKKLSRRFNAFSYYLFTKTMDSHNVGRARSSIRQALSLISCKTTIIGINSDQLFTLEDAMQLHEGITDSSLVVIDSNLGHDGFLTESTQINDLILTLFKTKQLQHQ